MDLDKVDEVNCTRIIYFGFISSVFKRRQLWDRDTTCRESNMIHF